MQIVRFLIASIYCRVAWVSNPVNLFFAEAKACEAKLRAEPDGDDAQHELLQPREAANLSSHTHTTHVAITVLIAAYLYFFCRGCGTICYGGHIRIGTNRVQSTISSGESPRTLRQKVPALRASPSTIRTAGEDDLW